ncbi:MAG: M48 family metalloprotease [Syntrophobacteraceae bacterium]
MKKALGAITAIIFTMVVLCPSGRVYALSLSEEKELGRQLLQTIRKVMPLVDDGEVLTYVRGVGNRVAKEIGLTSYQFQFFIVDHEVPNAFAIPGGYIFMFRGMIEMMSSEGELASILAHEMAHIQARHIHRRIEDSKVLSVGAIAGMLAGIFLGGNAGPAIAVGSMAASQTAALQYSRGHEMEADQLGFRFHCAAGYDPADMASIMHKMNQCKWLGNSRIPGYLSTHPALGERVQYLDEMAKKAKRSPKLAKPPVGEFQLMQAALVADRTDQARALERFQAGIKKGDKAAVFGLGRLYQRQNMWAEAVSQLQEAARVMPSSPFVLSNLGAAFHKRGKLQEAKSTLESALVLDPSSTIAHYRLALVLQELGKRDEALEHLMQIEELAPMFPDVDYQLGIILGQVNKLGLAHYHLGRFYLQKQNRDLAIMHYKKAKAYITDSPAKIEEINLVLKELEKKKKSGFSLGR